MTKSERTATQKLLKDYQAKWRSTMPDQSVRNDFLAGVHFQIGEILIEINQVLNPESKPGSAIPK